jgi:hypothetical protein
MLLRVKFVMINCYFKLICGDELLVTYCDDDRLVYSW